MTQTDMETLKERVKEGNLKLNKAWLEIVKIDHSSQRWKDEVERWHQANEVLSALCSNLQGIGFNDCLYIESGVKTIKCLEQSPYIGCRVCPSRIPYWEKELMELPSPREGKQKELGV